MKQFHARGRGFGNINTKLTCVYLRLQNDGQFGRFSKVPPTVKSVRINQFGPTGGRFFKSPENRSRFHGFQRTFRRIAGKF